MNDLLHMLFGAALVVVGVLSSAIADRIRGIRTRRELAARERKQADTAPGNSAEVAMSRDVVAALMTAGYSRHEATEATCGVPRSATATLESWTRAALGLCMRNGKGGRS